MTGQDLQKLMAAGFRVFYQDENNSMIRESKPGVAMKYGGPYKTKAEMQRVWADLMTDPKHISR